MVVCMRALESVGKSLGGLVVQQKDRRLPTDVDVAVFADYKRVQHRADGGKKLQILKFPSCTRHVLVQ